MNDTYENIEEYNPNKEHKVLILFNDTIAAMLINKKFQQLVTELFISSRKLNISIVFFHKILLCCTKIYQTKFHSLFYHDIPNKKQLQQISVNH